MFDPPVFGVNPSQPVAAVSTGMATARIGLRVMQMSIAAEPTDDSSGRYNRYGDETS